MDIMSAGETMKNHAIPETMVIRVTLATGRMLICRPRQLTGMLFPECSELSGDRSDVHSST
eukprot:scaffold1850_cov194-Pinguiococcus_pyrenoidosus.AAC.14